MENYGYGEELKTQVSGKISTLQTEGLTLSEWQYSGTRHLQSQHIPHQNPSCCFSRNGQADLKIRTEIQGTQNKQNNLGKEQQAMCSGKYK